ncbi:MAG: serine/threonine protein kinase [Planctomycetes bacterium]|nr:serine/threonine protein kinase [Planctomycetota bacterium]
MKLGMQSWARRDSPGAGDGGSAPTADRVRVFQAPSPAELAPRFPQLEIIALLGQGGMGAVYKARQKSLDRLVALKIINPDEADDPGFAGRFAREAKALARLNHPHIVGIHDFGETEGMYYFVMEFVDGVDLRSLIADGKLQPAEALALVPQICDALQFAHEEGIVHRDIKPENILVDKRGRVKIADFGLAKMLRLSAAERTITHTRQIVGTFHYMAPEQFERPGEIDHRVDIYALGVVFYEMLTGLLPVGRFDLPSQRCAVDARLDEVVLKALEREPDRRYQHASDVKTDVESLESVPQKAPRTSPASPAVPDPEALALVEEVREELALPAIWLMVYGGLALIAAVIGMAVLAYLEFVEDEVRFHEDMLLILGIILGGGLLGSIVLATGVKMRKLEGYDFVVAGSILTLLTLFSMFTAIAAIPLGIWCLLLLRRRDVRRAFALQRRLVREDPELAEQLSVKRTTAAPGFAMAALGVIEMVAPVVVLLFLNPGDRNDAGPIGLSLIPGAVMLAGGLAMLRLGPYELAAAGYWAAVLPCTPFWIVTLWVGLWASSVLDKPQVKAKFDHWGEAAPAAGPDPEATPAKPVEPPRAIVEKETADLEDARRSVKAPALALVGAGILSIFCAIAVVAIGLIVMVTDSRHYDGGGILSWIIVFGAPTLITAPLMIIGGLRMKQLESRWLALAAAIVAVLPLNVASLVAIPIGVWALVVLNRRNVEQAFREQPVRWEDWEHALRKTSSLIIAAAGLHVACVAPFWVVYVVAPPMGGEWLPITISLSAATGVIVLTSMTMLYGAVQMRRVQSRGWCLAAGAAALLPVSPAFLMSLPAGLCTLSLLTRPGVRDWFATAAVKG